MSDTITAWMLILTMVGLVLAVVFFANHAAKKRREGIAAWAQAQGLSYQRERDTSMNARYPFDCLRTGDRRYAENICAGRFGNYFVRAFDYHYQTYSTDSKGRRQTHHHNFSVLIVETQFPLRPLAIRTENFFDKIGEVFGFDDIDFELAEFSREFKVTSPDRRWAFDVLHQETMEFLLTSPRFQIQLEGHWLMVRESSHFEPDDFEKALHVAAGVISRLPRSVLRELKEQEAREASETRGEA